MTGARGVHLFTQQWEPVQPARAAVALVHGYAEHSGRYADIAAQFAASGIALYAFDLRGHGMSGGRPAFVRDFQLYTDDARLFISRVQTGLADTPLFLMGHSMGGTIAGLLLTDAPPPLSGAILSSAAIEVGMDLPRALRKAAGTIGKLFPHLPTIKLDRDDLSHSESSTHKAERDPLNYRGRMPAGTAAGTLSAAAVIRNHAADIHTPLLILHGTADRITGPGGSKLLYERAGSTDKTLRLFDGLYHETFNEPEGGRVLEEMISWMQARI